MIKLKINPYSKQFKEKFKKERVRISEIIKNCEVEHIGSTAVEKLGGKGIIDIMIGIESWKDEKDIVKKLKKLGFSHIHLKEKGRIFLSKDTTLSLDNVHIHIVKINSKAYKELLFFRDYLKSNRQEAKKYFILKKTWIKQMKGNRKKYQRLKTKYISQILKNIKQ